jgi:hypothetical protein
MPKHTWTISVKSDAGVGPAQPLPIYGSAEVNIGGNAAGQTGLQVGLASVEEVDNINIDVSALTSFFMKCDYDVEVRTNSWTSPAQEFNFDATEGMAWNDQNFPINTTNPLIVDITKIYVRNKGTKNGVAPTTPGTATFNAGFLMAEDVQFS